MMQGLANLFRRDLTRLTQELRAFPDDGTVWKTLPGIANSTGNLTRHLEGNLRHYIGTQLGHVPYTRNREAEFGPEQLPLAELVRRIDSLQPFVPDIIAGLNQPQLDAVFPELLWSEERITSQFLFHLYGHLNFHLGQIGYLRRALTGAGAVKFVQL